jgi:hypothetical protein
VDVANLAFYVHVNEQTGAASCMLNGLFVKSILYAQYTHPYR